LELERLNHGGGPVQREWVPKQSDRSLADTMQLRVGCEFKYDTDFPVPMLMMVRPRPDGEHHVLYESRWLRPEVSVHEYVDGFGNSCWRFVAPSGPITIRYDAVVEIDDEPDPVHAAAPQVPVQDLPDDTLIFTLPSRYVQSDLLLETAWNLFGQTPPGWARVQAICDWVHENVRFQMGSSTPTTTALEIYQQRVGVCRDFALLSVAFCRALNIPARYTFGYLPDIGIEPPDVPMDFHTWFEAFLGGRWFTFDARHNTPRIGRVVIGRGRDAVDVALTTSYGAARLEQMTVWADQIKADKPGGPPEDADELEAAGHADSATHQSGASHHTKGHA
jgi:transglutaminase-like putative cysteine protease